MPDDQSIITVRFHRNLANTFGKCHTSSILRAYDNLKCSLEFNRHNFALVDYYDEKHELRRSINMTKDGFTMLAMGGLISNQLGRRNLTPHLPPIVH